MGNLHKNILLMLEFQRVHFSHYTFLLYINDLSDDVMCNITVYADDTYLYINYDQASDLWQQLELASEFEFDL